MPRLSDAFIDDLLSRTDIVEVIGARVQLKRQGREYSARCPFHDERSPSFTVSPTKQFYHCFGCGAHGTAISFLMNYERLEFLDAVDELARRAGVEIPRDTRQQNQNPDTADLFDMLDRAARFFRQQLAASGDALAYLDRRGVDDGVRERFGIGYAPAGYQALRDALAGNDERKLKLLERAGLLSRNDKGHVYDKFRDRVMFPIHDRRGRVIAFGGRVMRAEDSPKYLNSPETPLFHKGRELYALWQARQANPKLERLVVVEGYMDVVALFQHDVTQAVATLGTATTPDHAELLFRSAPDVVFCFDGDAAGRRAAGKAMESVLPRMRDGRQAFFLFLPDGEDPDTLVRAEGVEGFEARVRDAVPLSTFFWDGLSEGIQLHTLDGKARLAERAKAPLAQIPDGAFADLMRARLTELTGVGARASAPDVHVPAQRARNAPAHTAPRRSLVRNAIALLLQQPSVALDVDPARLDTLDQPGVPLLRELVDYVAQRPDTVTGALLQAFADHEQAAALRKLAGEDFPGDSDGLRREFADTVGRLEAEGIRQRIDALQALFRDGVLDAAGKDELRALLAGRAAR